MQHKFTKSLLATAILFGLTACGSSGGGSGSSEPTTKVNTAVDTEKNVTNTQKEETITVPNATNNVIGDTSQNVTSKNDESIFNEINTSNFKIGNDGYATGRATYASVNSSIVLNADFDKRVISGTAKDSIDGVDVNITLHETTLYKGTARYIGGNYPDYSKTYDFFGSATGISTEKEVFSGNYAGYIHGVSSEFSQAGAAYSLKSDNDPTRIIRSAEDEVDSNYWFKGNNSYYRASTPLHMQ